MPVLGPDGRPLEVSANGHGEADALRRELQEATREQRVLSRQTELLAYEVLSNVAVDKGDIDQRDRIAIAKQARDVWTKDPQAGAAADLLNDFVFGRGVPRPRAANPKVKEVLDEAWEDPENQLVLTTYKAQVEKGTDLTLQANVFLLAFTGEDGRVKLGVLDHDRVKGVVRHPENRLRITHYVVEEQRYEWDFDKDRPKSPMDSGFEGPKTVYYEAWWPDREDEDFPRPAEDKLRPGLVYHVAINKTTEQAFGIPPMRRLMRWFSAYNEFMSSRVDVVKAAAAFIMKRRVKGGPAAVERIAHQVLNRRSELASAYDGDENGPPAPASILTENDGVVHEAMNLQTNAGNANQDGQMLRSQISAATHFPQHYLGDAGSANLATATSMELPVLKHVEGRQEVWEGVYRWFFDLVISEAQRVGRLPSDEQIARVALGEAHAGDEDHELDISYEFALPSPLRRMMGELVNSVGNLAKTFDPNGTNLPLTRHLLTIALRDGLEVQDPQRIVEDAFPPDYVDPMMAQFQQQQADAAAGDASFEVQPRGEPGQQPDQLNPFGGPSAASSSTPNAAGDASGNPYGANRGTRSRTPEEVQEAYRFHELPEGVQQDGAEAIDEEQEALRRDVFAILDAELAKAEREAVASEQP